MRKSAVLLGLLAAAGFLVPPIAALATKMRLADRDGAAFDEIADEIDQSRICLVDLLHLNPPHSLLAGGRLTRYAAFRP